MTDRRLCAWTGCRALTLPDGRHCSRCTRIRRVNVGRELAAHRRKEAVARRARTGGALAPAERCSRCQAITSPAGLVTMAPVDRESWTYDPGAVVLVCRACRCSLLDAGALVPSAA